MEMNRNTESGSDESPENIFALSFSKGEESFPVLKAFQEFLDVERERARRRQLVLTLSFMSAIVLLVVLFCVIGAILFSGMARRNDVKQDKLFEILLMERKAAPVPVPVVIPDPPRQDPVVDEVMELVKQLRAETAALKAELQRAAEAQPVVDVLAPASVSEEPAPKSAEVKPEPAPKRTGVFSSPKRKPDLPAPTVDVDVVTAEPVPEVSEAIEQTEPEKKTELAHSEGSGDGLVQVQIVPSRVMHAPPGYDAGEISIVTEDNVRYPWRVLVPAVASGQMEME